MILDNLTINTTVYESFLAYSHEHAETTHFIYLAAEIPRPRFHSLKGILLIAAEESLKPNILCYLLSIHYVHLQIQHHVTVPGSGLIHSGFY